MAAAVDDAEGSANYSSGSDCSRGLIPLAVATCCHHRCEWGSYCNPRFLQVCFFTSQIGLNANG